MSAGEFVLLVGAGLVGGVCGAVAGLASLVSFPVLLAVGLDPLTANVTNAVALVLSSAGSSAASRPELRGQGRRVRWLLGLTVAGGLAGSALLLATPAGVFEAVVPALIAAGSLLLLLQPWIPGLRGGRYRERSVASAALISSVAVYGGYFGAGAGVMMLALLAIYVPEPVARLNALKNVCLGVANAVAATYFVLFGTVRWVVAAPLALGFLAGGAASPALVRRLPAEGLRIGIALAGLALAGKLALDALA
jgi:uncharacterized membrane protein YfcA